MLNLAELKARRDLLAAIDWELTPGEAFTAYQLRSKDNWRARDLPEVLYFYLSTWRERPRLMLCRRHYVASEELAAIEPPAELLPPLAELKGADELPRGQHPLPPALKAWLKKELAA